MYGIRVHLFNFSSQCPTAINYYPDKLFSYLLLDTRFLTFWINKLFGSFSVQNTPKSHFPNCVIFIFILFVLIFSSKSVNDVSTISVLAYFFEFLVNCFQRPKYAPPQASSQSIGE